MKIPRMPASTKRRILSSAVLRSVMSVTAPITSMLPDESGTAWALTWMCLIAPLGITRRYSCSKSVPLGYAFDDLLCKRPIVGMYALEHHVQGWFLGAVVLENPIGFV